MHVLAGSRIGADWERKFTNGCLSVITQIDGQLVEFDDGRKASLSVIGCGIAGNGDIGIKIAMSLRTMNDSAVSGEAGGARRWTVVRSERWVVDAERRVRADHVVRGPVVVVAVDLVAVARFEQVEEVPDEVVDLDDRVITEPGHRDGGAGGMVWVGWHGDHRRAAVRRGAGASGWANTSR